jgi:hypothetical protein
MKKQIFNVLILGLFVAAILIGINTSWACKSAQTQSIFSEDDPNDPGPEFVPMSLQPIYADEDPNDPNDPGPE